MDNKNNGDAPQPHALQPLLPTQPPQTNGGSVTGKTTTIVVMVGEGGSIWTEIPWPRSSRCKDKIKTVHIMEEEEGVVTKELLEICINKIHLFIIITLSLSTSSH
jgi:hypothetical protein